MLMEITTTTFNTNWAGGKGGVIYCDNLKKVTINGLTATDFDAPSSSSTTGGRFWYHTGNTAFEMVITSNTFTCDSTAFTLATV